MGHCNWRCLPDLTILLSARLSRQEEAVDVVVVDVVVVDVFAPESF